MAKPISTHFYFIRDSVSALICVLSCAVLLDTSWFMPDHNMALKGMFAFLLGFGIWLDWRSGVLSAKLSDLPEEIGRRGVMAYGFARPFGILALVLFSQASPLI